MNYIVKLVGARAAGRNVSGEYCGGKTLDEARAEAANFAAHLTDGQVIICSVRKDGTLTYVEEIKSASCTVSCVTVAR